MSSRGNPRGGGPERGKGVGSILETIPNLHKGDFKYTIVALRGRGSCTRINLYPRNRDILQVYSSRTLCHRGLGHTAAEPLFTFIPVSLRTPLTVSLSPHYDTGRSLGDRRSLLPCLGEGPRDLSDTGTLRNENL